MLRNHAVVCYAAALDVLPTHPDGANQLGYSLLKLDRLDEAQAVLSQATQSHPSTDAWRNMAEVFRRRGQPDQAALASQQAEVLAASNTTSAVPEVVQVDPQTFVGMSPNQFMSGGPTPSSAHFATDRSYGQIAIVV